MVKIVLIWFKSKTVGLCLLSAEVITTHKEAFFLLEVAIKRGVALEASWDVLLDTRPTPDVADLLR